MSIKKIFWISVIILIASGVRVVFNSKNPGYMTTGDTVSYYLTAKIFSDKKILVDPWRTPLYPVVMGIPFVLSGKPLPDTLPRGEFSNELWSIRVAQSIAGVIAIVLLFHLLLALSVPMFLAGVTCVLLSINTKMLFFEYILATEPLALLWLVGTSLVTVQLLKKFSATKFIIVTVLLILGVFLRPIYVAFPVIVFGVLCLRYANRKVFIWSIIAGAIYAGILVGYCRANYAVNGYNGISRISDANLLGEILLYRLPVENAPEASGIKTIVSAYMREGGVPDPWQVYLRNTQLYDVAYANPMHVFVVNVIAADFPLFFLRATEGIPGIISALSEFQNVSQRPGAQSILWDTAMYSSYVMQYTECILFLAAPILLYMVFKKRTVLRMSILFIVLTGLYHMIFTVYVSYEQRQRFLSEIIPLLYAVCTFGISHIIRRTGEKPKNIL